MLELIGWDSSLEIKSVPGGDIEEVTYYILQADHKAQTLLVCLWGNRASIAGKECPYTNQMVHHLLTASQAKAAKVVFTICGTRVAFATLNPSISEYYDSHMNWLRDTIRICGGTVITGTNWL